MIHSLRQPRALALVGTALVLAIALVSCRPAPLVFYTMDSGQGAATGGAQRVFPHFIDQPTVLAFWDTVSLESIECLEGLNTLSYREGPVQLVGVCSSGDLGRAIRWMRRQNVVFETIADPEGKLAQKLRVDSFPTFIFFDAAGKEIDRRLSIRTVHNWFDREQWHCRADPRWQEAVARGQAEYDTDTVPGREVYAPAATGYGPEGVPVPSQQDGAVPAVPRAANVPPGGLRSASPGARTDSGVYREPPRSIRGRLR